MERVISRFRRRVALLTGYHADDSLTIRIRFRQANASHPALGDDESYRLRVSGGIELDAETQWGVMRGLETVLQLLERGNDDFRLAHCEIEDAPRFPWRGLMLDLARHWIPVDAVLRTLEGMAALKLNVLHLHLSDDQAFRVESICHPALASDPALSLGDMELIVSFAADLGIRVVPEIDMPGHVTCWLEAYPALAARQGSYRAAQAFGIHRGALDPTREEVYGLLGELLAEVASRFPDGCLHIGGDEVHPEAWTDPRIGEFMRVREIADARALQSYFNRRVATILGELGRAPIGWDEVLHPDLGPQWLVQCWRHVSHRDRALAAGYDCIYSAGYYLDLNLPAGWHYRVDPEDSRASLEALDREMWLLPGLAGLKDVLGTHAAAQSDGAALPQKDRSGRVLGGEACMWSELVTDELLDRRVFSRLPAIAERLWSPRDVTDQRSLYERIPEVWGFLARSTPVDVEASGARLLSRLCETPGLRDFANLLEPIKWYRRHIGDAAIRARAEGGRLSGRPYDVHTPLNRLVDVILPESLEARRLSHLVSEFPVAPQHAAVRLREHAGNWRRIAHELHSVNPQMLAEVMPLVELLPKLADLLERHLERGVAKGSPDVDAETVLERASEAMGECELAIVASLRVLLEQRR